MNRKVKEIRRKQRRRVGVVGLHQDRQGVAAIKVNFKCMQRILSPPQELDDLYKSTCGGDSRNISQHSTKSILRCGSVASKSRQHCRRRPKRVPINPRSGDGDEVRSTSAPFASEDLIVVQPPD